MKLADTIFVWTSDEDSKDVYPTRGKLAAAVRSELHAPHRYAFHYGAGDILWDEADNAERRRLLVELVRRMIIEDGILESGVLDVLNSIDDIDPEIIIAAAKSNAGKA